MSTSTSEAEPGTVAALEARVKDLEAELAFYKDFHARHAGASSRRGWSDVAQGTPSSVPSEDVRGLSAEQSSAAAPPPPPGGGMDAAEEERADSRNPKRKLNVALEYTRDSPMSRRQMEAFAESMASLKKFMQTMIVLGSDFVAKSRQANECAVLMAQELSKREYSRLFFTNTFTDLGDLSTEMINFSESLQRVTEVRSGLLSAFESGFLSELQTFVHQDLGDIANFTKDTWALGDKYESALSRLLEQPAANATENEKGVLVDLRLRYELSRFEIVKYLNRLDAKKKVSLLRAMNQALCAVGCYFEQGAEQLSVMRAVVEDRGRALSNTDAELELEEEVWLQTRGRLEAELLGALPPPGSPAGAQAPIAPRPSQQPYAGALTTEVLSQASLNATHDDLAHARDEGVLKQGFLFHVTAMSFFSRRRKWYRLYRGSLYYINPNDLEPKYSCDVHTCSVHARPDGSQLPHCFIVVQANGTNLKFQAENDDELLRWISAIRRCQAKWRLSSRADARVETADHINADLLHRVVAEHPLCADCGAPDVEWVSTTFGITLCVDCACAHRKLSSEVSLLRSIYMDLWSTHMLTCLLAEQGNARVNAIWEPQVPQGWDKPEPKSPMAQKEQWVVAKYKWFGFVDEVRVSVPDCSRQLAEAAAAGDAAKVIWCVAHKANVNWQQDAEHGGKTPLHLACAGGHINCVALLVQNGANLFAVDNAQQTALDLTCLESHDQIAQLLTEKQQAELW